MEILMTTQNLPSDRRTCTKGVHVQRATNVLSQSIEQSFKILAEEQQSNE